VDCSQCNERFGGTIDAAVGEQVAVIRNLLQLESGTGNVPPMLRKIKSGDDTINIRSDGRPELVAKPFTVTQHADGSASVQIIANKREDITKIIPHLAAHLRCDEEKLKQALASAEASVISKRPDTVHHVISFGGPSVLRSVAKSCLILWALRVGNEEVKLPIYEDVRRFVLEGNNAFNLARIHLDSRRLPCVEELERRFWQVL
jgi:hypothetical protein